MHQHMTKNIKVAKDDPEKEKERYEKLVQNYKSELNR